MSKLRDMKKRFLPLSMLLITIVLAQASFVANAAGGQGKYTPRNGSKATFSSFMKSIRANQETGLIDPALMIAGQKAAQQASKDADPNWVCAGPDNFGGMTRAMAYNNEGKMVIGTMGGDIFVTDNGGITFGKVTSSNKNISCMVKASDGVMYVGTGDGRGAQKLNGLAHLGYETSFVGNGVYKLEGNDLVLVSGTENIAFVNELAVAGDDIYAATSDGLLKNWAVEVAGNFISVKTNSNGDVLAADESNVYLSKNGGSFNNISNGIEANNNPKIIAMSPSDPNFMYIAYLEYSGTAYSTGNIYFTDNGGESWGIAMAATTLYAIFGSDADHDGFMVVYPNNPRKLLIGATNLWVFEDVTGQGVNSYRPQMISYSSTSSYSSIYLHHGIQNVVFNPTNVNMFFIGTNGGVFKGTYAQNNFKYTGCNRYYVTDDVHTSVTRMMNVGLGGVSGMVLGACLDHGTISMSGSELVNNVTTGECIFPHITNNNYASSYFTKAYAGGPCIISTVDPNIMFVSGTGSLSTPIYRTQTGGVDYDGNFEGGGDSPVVTNANAFKTPYALHEEYNDAHSQTIIREPVDLIIDSTYVLDSVVYIYDTLNVLIDSTIYEHWDYEHLYDTLDHVIDLDTLFLAVRGITHVGQQTYYYSQNAGYPIDYVMPALPSSLMDDDHLIINQQGQPEYVWIKGDTITGLHNPITSTYVVAIEDAVYMTRDALIFNKATDWFEVAKIDGLPTAIAMSQDGNIAMVGTTEGSLYKFSNLGDVFFEEQADVTDVVNGLVTMEFDTVTFKGRAITSIAIDPMSAANVVVTLGNYGNTNYVYKSTNGGTSFTSIQGSLGAFPVYSSIIEKESGNVYVATEHGVYALAGSSWSPVGNISCPVMEIKQATMDNHPDKIDYLVDEVGDTTVVVYPGIFNDGDIYIATYGAGILKYEENVGGSEPGGDNDDNTVTNNYLRVYPNPVRDFAQFDINVDNNTSVSYVIYDLSGRMVTNGDLGKFNEGYHTLNIDTKDLTTGSYIIRVIAGDKTETGKFLVY